MVFTLRQCFKTNSIIRIFSLIPNMNIHHYRPHPEDGEGTVFTGVCLSTGGTPVPCSFPGLWSQVLSGGYPSPGWGYPRTGYPPARSGLGYVPTRPWLENPPPPSQDRTGVPLVRTGIPPGTHLPQDRTAERVLATHRAVCLLRSLRRTFFFILDYPRCLKKTKKY